MAGESIIKELTKMVVKCRMVASATFKHMCIKVKIINIMSKAGALLFELIF